MAMDKGRQQKIRQIVNAVRALVIADRRQSKRLARTYKITSRQAAALRIVSESPGTSLSELSERMFLHISTSSGVVDRLEKKHFMVRKRTPEDRRVVRLYVTPKGGRLIRSIPLSKLGLLTRDIDALRDSEIREIWIGLNGLLKLLRLEKEASRVDKVE